MDWENKVRQKIDEAWEKILKKDIRNFSWDNFRFRYRAEHTELVVSIGMEIGKMLGADEEILRAALLLHDIGRGDLKKGHAESGARLAGEILKNTNFPQRKIADVKYAIASHAGWNKSKPETLEACILWDADKLSKLGAFIIVQQAMRWTLQGKNTWDAVSEFNKWLKTAEYIKDNMKTAPGLKMAEKRFGTLRMFVTALNKEVSLK